MNESYMMLVNVLAQFYGLNKDNLKISKISAGVENSNYLVKTLDKKFVFRRYNQLHSIRGARTKASIELELNFSQRALAYGIPTPRVIPNTKKETYTISEYEGRENFFVLFEFSQSQSSVACTASITKDVAHIVDLLFDVGSSFATIDVNDTNNIITRALQKYDELKDSPDARLHNLRNELQSRYISLADKNLTKGLVHGDLKLENLLFTSNGELCAVLDFDDYRYSYMIEESVMALMHNLHSTTENIIRSGNYEYFINSLENPLLLKELDNLQFFLKIIFFYDLCKYTLAVYNDIVDALWSAPHITQCVLKKN